MKFGNKKPIIPIQNESPQAPVFTGTIDDYLKIPSDLADLDMDAGYRAKPYRTAADAVMNSFKKANLEETTPIVRNIIAQRSMTGREAFRTRGTSSRTVSGELNKTFPKFKELFGKSIYVFPSEEGWKDVTRQMFGFMSGISMMNTAAFQIGLDPSEVANYSIPTMHQRTIEAITGPARTITEERSFFGSTGDVVGGKVNIEVPNASQILHFNMTDFGKTIEPKDLAGSIQKNIKTTGHELTHVVTAEAGIRRDDLLKTQVESQLGSIFTQERKNMSLDSSMREFRTTERYKKFIEHVTGEKVEYFGKEMTDARMRIHSKLVDRLSKTPEHMALRISTDSPEIQELISGTRAFMHEKVMEEVTAEVGGLQISLRAGNGESILEHINKVASVGYYRPDSWSGYSKIINTDIKRDIEKLVNSGLLVNPETGLPFSQKEGMAWFQRTFERDLLNFSAASFHIGMENSILAMPDTEELIPIKQGYLAEITKQRRQIGGNVPNRKGGYIRNSEYLIERGERTYIPDINPWGGGFAPDVEFNRMYAGLKTGKESPELDVFGKVVNILSDEEVNGENLIGSIKSGVKGFFASRGKSTEPAASVFERGSVSKRTIDAIVEGGAVAQRVAKARL